MSETLCIGCGEPVMSRSTAGDNVCPACDVGRCRYCGVRSPLILKPEIDGGRSVRDWHAHMAWHHAHDPVTRATGDVEALIEQQLTRWLVAGTIHICTDGRYRLGSADQCGNERNLRSVESEIAEDIARLGLPDVKL